MADDLRDFGTPHRDLLLKFINEIAWATVWLLLCIISHHGKVEHLAIGRLRLIISHISLSIMIEHNQVFHVLLALWTAQ